MSRRSKIIVLSTCFIAILSGILAFLGLQDAREGTVVQLNAAETAKALQSSRLPRALNRLQHTMHKHPALQSCLKWMMPKEMLFSSFIFEAPPDFGEQIHMGPPVLTNEQGTRIWIMSAQQYSNFLSNVVTNQQAEVSSRPLIVTQNGIPVILQHPSRMYAGSFWGPVPPFIPNPPNQVQVVVKPTLKPGGVKLTAGLTIETNVSGSLKTNYFMGFSAKLKTGDSLLVDADSYPTKKGPATTVWLLLRPEFPVSRSHH